MTRKLILTPIESKEYEFLLINGLKEENAKLKEAINTALDALIGENGLPSSIHSILVKVISEAYRIGCDDGYANIYNAEFVGEDQTKLLPIEGEESVVSMLLKKYCA